MTGDEAVPDTIIVCMQDDICRMEGVRPDVQSAQNSEELTFKNYCCPLTHIDLLQQIQAQFLGQEALLYPHLINEDSTNPCTLSITHRLVGRISEQKPGA